jgi:hypothetical protein
MGKIRTSAISYWRGVPKNLHGYGYLTQANYPIVQPQQIVLNSIFNNKTKIQNKFKQLNNYMNIQNLNSVYM